MKKSERDLIGRAVVDAEFRGRLLKDPDGVVEIEGYEISDDARARLRETASLSPAAVEAAIATAAREGGVGC